MPVLIGGLLTWAGAAALATPYDVAAQEQAAMGEAALFSSHEPLRVVFVADFEALLDDRSTSPERPAMLRLPRSDGDTVVIAGELQTRGAFRLAECSFPPLRLDVDDSDAVGTPFEGRDNLKLVGSCRPGRESWQELVTKEYLAYRTVQAVTDASFRVRRIHATFVDVGGRRSPETREIFAIEEDEALARRLGATVFDLEEGKNLPVEAFEPVQRMTNAVAQYMLGNTDWSDVAGHNVELLERGGGAALVVPYDFDFSGVVDAPYAAANPDFQLESVRERYYRGWCENPLTTRTVLQRFRDAESEIRELWADAGGLSESVRRRSLRYLDDFFDDIETEDSARRAFLRDCRTPR